MENLESLSTHHRKAAGRIMAAVLGGGRHLAEEWEAFRLGARSARFETGGAGFLDTSKEADEVELLLERVARAMPPAPFEALRDVLRSWLLGQRFYEPWDSFADGAISGALSARLTNGDMSEQPGNQTRCEAIR